MKKIIILLSTLFLVACGSSTIDLSDIGKIKLSDLEMYPQYASVEEEDTLNVVIEWKRGTNEDSMEKSTFASSGIIFFAEQNGVELEGILEGSRMFDEAYEGSEHNIYVKFKLVDKDNPVDIKAYDVPEEDGKSFTVNLK